MTERVEIHWHGSVARPQGAAMRLRYDPGGPPAESWPWCSPRRVKDPHLVDSGGMDDGYRAHDTTLGRIVLKPLVRTPMHEPGRVARLRRPGRGRGLYFIEEHPQGEAVWRDVGSAPWRAASSRARGRPLRAARTRVAATPAGRNRSSEPAIRTGRRPAPGHTALARAAASLYARGRSTPFHRVPNRVSTATTHRTFKTSHSTCDHRATLSHDISTARRRFAVGPGPLTDTLRGSLSTTCFSLRGFVQPARSAAHTGLACEA